MKKTIRFFAIAAVFAVMGTACDKDQTASIFPQDEEKTDEQVMYDSARYLIGFGAKMEKTKADLNDGTGKFSWTDGDVVKVFNSDGESATYSYSASKSKFEPKGEPLEKNDNPMHAFFPADNFEWVTDHVQFTMPAAFESLTGIMNPMAAVVPADASSGTEITLLNLGGIYEIKMTSAKTKGEKVTKVELGNTGVNITGSAAVSFDGGGTPSIGALSGAKSVTLEFASPVTLSSTPKSVYFFLPVTGANEFEGMYVKLVYGKTVDAVTYEPFEQKTRNSAMTVTRCMRMHMNFSANGFFSGGDGSETNPYRITTAEDFKAIKGKMVSTEPADGYVSETGTFFGSTGVHYQQTSSFECGDITANMIGTSTVPFKGTYDGAGNELKDVVINADADFAGVFGYVNGGDEASGCGVKNLRVSGTITSSAAAVGGIVGRLQSGTILGCTNSAAVKGKRLVGGIVGFMYNGKVSACRNNADVEGTGSTDSSDGEIGGIVGTLRGGTMVDCYSKQGVTIKGLKRVGGLAGYFSNQGNGAALIVNCASASNVLSTQGATNNYGVAGGLVGYMYATADVDKTVVLTNSVALSSSICNTGSTSAQIGAIVGLMNGADGSEGNILVRNCYSQHNSTSLTGSSVYYSSSADGSTITNTKQTNMGAIYGKRTKGYIKDCYCAGNNTGGYGITSASANVYVGVGTSASGSGATANCRAVHNNVINGTGTDSSVSYTSGSINFNSISLKDNSPLNGLTAFMNLGTWATSAKEARSEYTSSYSTETLSEWVGKGTGTQAYPKTLNDLGYYD